MKGIFRSKYTLIVVYIIMAAICIYLNVSAESLDLSNVIVSLHWGFWDTHSRALRWSTG